MRPASLRTRSFDVELPCVRAFCPSRFEYEVNTEACQSADPDLKGLQWLMPTRAMARFSPNSHLCFSQGVQVGLAMGSFESLACACAYGKSHLFEGPMQLLNQDRNGSGRDLP